MISYSIGTGQIKSADAFLGTGYSGHGPGRNNPAMTDMPDIGPLPVGKYRIGPAYDDPHLGPCVMHLDPLPGTEVFGRSLFRIHGDSKAQPGQASHGCLVTGPDVRKAIKDIQDRVLEVTA